MKQLIVLLIILSSTVKVEAQNLTNESKRHIIDAISFHLKDKYVFPDIALSMEADLLKRWQVGEYDHIVDKNIFADSLKNHLYMVSKDKHIGVSYNEVMASRLREPKEDPTEEFNRINDRVRKFNYGFEELKIMEGNVGYLKLGGFAPTKYAGKTASSAMQFLSNSDALIVDLRDNMGGDDSMIQLLISYLYSEKPVRLNNFYHKEGDETTQLWTLPYVEGSRMPDIPVYVLINEKTISAGEEFAYDLKHLKRAKIIGETSAGAANFGEEFVVYGDFIAWIPTGRAINPITKTNWEGKGVEPHINVKSVDALDTAYQLAKEALNE
ncbi:S41 family peptidase [Lewinella sp. IMCC34191]|uniref:S41 family peptidase n=1 Tax=Lewinella sp. IMCC34191 TaxID=2259172 RepID=UPI000E27E4FE|nr:S41 family peptidase [Lewinella sp. IMCC34191]